MITRRVILNWTVRGLGGTAGAGAITAGIYGVLITIGWSQVAPFQMLAFFVAFGVVGLLLGVLLGLINGLLLGILTCWRFLPLRHARKYRWCMALGGFVLNTSIIGAIALALLATSTPEALQAFWHRDVLSEGTILYFYVPIAVAYVSVQVVNWRCAQWYIAAADNVQRDQGQYLRGRSIGRRKRSGHSTTLRPARAGDKIG
jgi:hypothetical protein